MISRAAYQHAQTEYEYTPTFTRLTLPPFDASISSAHMKGMSEPSHHPVQIFDRSLQRRRYRRAMGRPLADFLLERVTQDFAGRLATIKRDFPIIADIGTPLPSLAACMAARPTTSHLLRLAPIAGYGPPNVPRTDVMANEEALPLAPASIDLAVSAFSLHNVNDLPGALVQIRQALKPDGMLMACMAGGQTLHELRTVFARAEAEIIGGASPHVSPFADVRDMGGLLQRAGFALPVADAETITVRYGSMFGLMADLRAMGSTNILHQRSRKPLRRAVLLRAAALYAELFNDADGRVRATFDLIWLSGWAPHESQQKPLKPGSARMRLADALKTQN